MAKKSVEKEALETVCELIKFQLDVTSIKGFGPKSQAALAAFIKKLGWTEPKSKSEAAPGSGWSVFFFPVGEKYKGL